MPEPTLDIPVFIPPMGDQLLADQALDAVGDQFPDVMDLTNEAQADETEPFGLTWQWDFEKNRFVTDGLGAPKRVYELDNLRNWVQTHLMIARNAHPIFSDDVGIEGGWGDATGGVGIGELPTDPAVQEDYMQAVFDALMIHDRITDVSEFSFYQLPEDLETLYVDFEIILDSGQIVPVVLPVQEI